MTKGTELTCQNGTTVNLEPRYLDDEFCEAAKEYYSKKNKFPIHGFNSYFTALAIKQYIIETNCAPIYEEN
jgi:hypothetical protein